MKDLFEDNQSKNESLINLRNSINSDEIPENENLKKVVNIVEKILDFNKQQKSKGLPGISASCLLDLAKHIKMLTPEQMFQVLPTALP